MRNQSIIVDLFHGQMKSQVGTMTATSNKLFMAISYKSMSIDIAMARGLKFCNIYIHFCTIVSHAHLNCVNF